MADGSHGCSPNWADFPVAAMSRPRSGIVLLLCVMKICWSSHELEFRQNHAMVRMKPMSPIRL